MLFIFYFCCLKDNAVPRKYCKLNWTKGNLGLPRGKAKKGKRQVKQHPPIFFCFWGDLQDLLSRKPSQSAKQHSDLFLRNLIWKIARRYIINWPKVLVMSALFCLFLFFRSYPEKKEEYIPPFHKIRYILE